MKNTPEHILFEPSGCLSREGLLLFAQGKLSAQEMAAVKAHLQTCEFCVLAAEGMAMADPQEFDQDLAAIYASLKKVNLGVEEEESVSEYGEAEVLPSKGRKSKKAVKGQKINKTALPQKSFFVRYRLELIAAVILLFLALGARLIYVGFRSDKQSMELAHAPVNSEAEEAVEITQQQITEIEVPAEEKAETVPIPPKTTQIEVVSDDLEVVMDAEGNISVSEEPNIYNQGKAAPETEEDLLHSGESMASEIETTQQAAPETSKNQAIIVEEQVSGAFEKERQSKGTVMRKQNAMEEEVAETEIFIVVESQPEFPGGDEKRLEFISENITYPHLARESAIQGTVYVTFVVDRDGSITDAKVLRGIGAGCDEEALRVIRLMPKWKPGTQRGKPVRVQMTFPIKFSLAGKVNEAE